MVGGRQIGRPTPGVAALAKRESIDTAQEFSDHAPLTIDHDFTL